MFERCIYFNTNALTRKLNVHWERAFARYDLAPSHGYLVRLILEKPGISQQSITQELQLEKSTITRFLTVLEKRAFIIRKPSDADPRQNVIFPTKKALKLEAELTQLGDELYKDMCAAIGAENVKTFVNLTRTINQRLSA